MHAGQVRAILGRHAGAASLPPSPPRPARVPAPVAPAADPALPAPLPDPNALVPAQALWASLEGRDEAQQRALATAYVHLWARTFRPLVRQLRGRPERCLALFADEVYPFLRGDRLAARVASVEARGATLVLAGGLPDAYLAGLVEGFVALSGAAGQATVKDGLVTVRYRLTASDRLARLAQHVAGLRLNLVACALLAAVVGIALAVPHATVTASRAVAVLGGVAAAQIAANALHALRHHHPAGPLASTPFNRRLLRVQLGVAGALALAVAAWLTWTGTPLVLLFAAAGLGAGLLYAPLRNHGLGPLVTLVLYGPLIVEGALHAFPVGAQHVHHLALLPWTLVPGAMAAATLYVDDLADAPLDEAGGKRTLAVRLPGRAQGLVYSLLLSAAFLPLLFLGRDPRVTLTAGALALLALVLIFHVRASLGHPRRLAVARLGTQTLHAATTLGLAAVLGGWA